LINVVKVDIGANWLKSVWLKKSGFCEKVGLTFLPRKSDQYKCANKLSTF